MKSPKISKQSSRLLSQWAQYDVSTSVKMDCRCEWDSKTVHQQIYLYLNSQLLEAKEMIELKEAENVALVKQLEIATSGQRELSLAKAVTEQTMKLKEKENVDILT